MNFNEPKDAYLLLMIKKSRDLLAFVYPSSLSLCGSGRKSRNTRDRCIRDDAVRSITFHTE